MIHLFKLDGPYKRKDGLMYDCKCVNESQVDSLLSGGWVKSLDKLTVSESVPESGSDYEAELRAEIAALGGKAGGRSSIKTLEKQLAELKNVSED